MSVQLLIAMYAIICLSMIAYNCVCALWFRSRDGRMKRICRRYQALIDRGQWPEGPGRRRLLRRLGRVNELLAFSDALEQSGIPLTEACGAVEILRDLLPRYVRRSDMKRACYAHALARFRVTALAYSDELIVFLLGMVSGGSIYRRENAMRALYASGQAEPVVQALQMIDESEYYYNEKLIAEGLLSFSGDREGLISALWPLLDRFHSEMRVAVLNFVRFGSAHWGQEMLELLERTDDAETAIACLRYLGRCPFPEALPAVRAEAAQTDSWERCAVAMTALASYPGEETIALLKQGLVSTNWYVRANASASLFRLGADYSQIQDVLEGPDPYARQILNYRYQRVFGLTEDADAAAETNGG